MKYFFDTEFEEKGHKHPLMLISLGIVAEDGREFYVENSDVDTSKLNPWLQDNVVPYLRGPGMPHSTIGPAVLKFIGMDPQPRFWAYFADYDWVLFCQLFGSMLSMPETFPHLCLDLKQEMTRLKVEKPTLKVAGTMPDPSHPTPHDALYDARWNKALYEWMVRERGLKP